VRFNDPDNLASCANFLAHAFPGEIERDGHVLELEIRQGIHQGTEERVIGRLLRAWRLSHDIDDSDGVVMKTDDPRITKRRRG
jgi:hypothetical protein